MLLQMVKREFPEFGKSGGAGPVVARVSRAPGRLDVMGGSAEFGGGMTCSTILDCGVAVAVAPRNDGRQLLYYFDPANQKRISVWFDEIVTSTGDELHSRFGAHVQQSVRLIAGCFMTLIGKDLIDQENKWLMGFDLAVVSNIPRSAGIASAAALAVATVVSLREHFKLSANLNTMQPAAICQEVLMHLDAGASDVTPSIACCSGRAGMILKQLCQPNGLQELQSLPEGIRIIGIDTGVRRDPEDQQFQRTRTSARMGQMMILAKMREMGEAAGMKLIADPMRGYLANLALDDYKKYFRSFLPEAMRGADLLSRSGSPEAAWPIDGDVEYAVQSATDHHVHEPVRVKNFVQFMEQAAALEAHSPQRSVTLDKAGHLMYASHISCTRDAKLGAPEADLLVDLVRKNERAGLYGAKITARGQGGTVAVLANDTEKASEVIRAIAAEYQRQTGKVAAVFWNSSPGALEAGTEMVSLD